MAQKLLLADDSVTIQRVIELTFADENIDVVAVSDGDQAIARLDADPPDIVLADIGMPGKDGYEVASYVKHSPRLAHIPVVLLTGAFEPIDQARAESAGSDGVLAKPFEPQLVIARVKELLSQPSRAPMPDASMAPAAAPTTDTWPPRSAAHSTGARQDDGALDDYFDRLDAAFAGRSAQSSAATLDRAQGGPDMKWFKKPVEPEAEPPAATPAVDFPLAAEPAAFAPAPIAPPVAADSTPAMPASPTFPAAPAALPSLGDAFAALLAAEAAAPDAASWPGSGPVPAPAPIVNDDIIEQIVRRVLERMTDRVVRDTTAEIVRAAADRLVREEIDRIKATIK